MNLVAAAVLKRTPVYQATLALIFEKRPSNLDHSFRQAHESCITSSSWKSLRAVAGTGRWNPDTGWLADLVHPVKKPSALSEQRKHE